MKESRAMKTFVANVLACMQAEGWTITRLAAEAGMRRPDLSAILSGRRPGINVTTAERLALALGCRLDHLFSPDFSLSRRKSA